MTGYKISALVLSSISRHGTSTHQAGPDPNQQQEEEEERHGES